MPRKVTKLDYAIMGLLSGRAMTGYEVRKIFEVSEMGNYSSSPGAIYPSLKRLQGLSMVKREKEEGTGKPLFALSEEGLITLKEWLCKPLAADNLTRNLDEILLRFAFMDGLVSPQGQVEFLESFIVHLRTIIKEMKTFHRIQGPALPLHGRLAFENGVAIHQAHLRWAIKALVEIKYLVTEIS